MSGYLSSTRMPLTDPKDGIAGENVTDWSSLQVAKYVSTYGLPQYVKAFQDHEINGDVLMHLDHDSLRDIGVHSVGHRLILLKSFYELKFIHHIPIEADQYVPPSVEELMGSSMLEKMDISRILSGLRARDERIAAVGKEMRRLSENMIRLRDDLLPVFRSLKERKPLPTPENISVALNNNHSVQTAMQSPSVDRPPGFQSNPQIDSKISDYSYADQRQLSSSPGLINKGSTKQTYLNAVSKHSTSPITSDSEWPKHERAGPSQPLPPAPLTGPPDAFKSFRLTKDDPCYKVLPAALKRYKVNDDWRQYALFICYGDQERCLGLDEKPLALFHQLQKEGRNPVFMLRHMDSGRFSIGGTPGGVL